MPTSRRPTATRLIFDDRAAVIGDLLNHRAAVGCVPRDAALVKSSACTHLPLVDTLSAQGDFLVLGIETRGSAFEMKGQIGEAWSGRLQSLPAGIIRWPLELPGNERPALRVDMDRLS